MGKCLADDCGGFKRLDQKNPDGSDGSMMHVPVLDQGNVGICYAFTAAEVTQAWMCSHGDCTHQPSGVSIAVDAAMSESGSDRSFMDIAETRPPAVIINELMEKKVGFCKSQIWSKNIDDNYLNAMGSIFESHKRYVQEMEKALGISGHAVVTPIYLGSAPDRTTTDAKNIIECLSEAGIDSGVLPNIALVRKILHETDPLVFSRELLAPGCDQAHFVPNLPKMESIAIHESCHSLEKDPLEKARCLAGDEIPAVKQAREDAPKTINKVLDSGQPLVVGYCGEVIGRDGPGKSYQPDPHYDQCSNHGSLIMGRRKDKSGKCQYLLRNTWGAGCGLHPDWECDKDSKGEDDGNFWIDSDVLLKASTNIDYFSNPNL
jgi:hypothetical protein